MTMVAALSATAQDGTTAYNFLDVTPSSHVYGLGGHNVSLIDDDIQLVEQNPALLGPEFEQLVGLNYMRYMGSSNFMGARYGTGINDRSAWAAAIQYFGYGTMTATDVEGNVTGSFSARTKGLGEDLSSVVVKYAGLQALHSSAVSGRASVVGQV